jgi:hypothetical protein
MSGIDRRAFLCAGAAATLGCALPPVLPDPPRKIKGVIWLWMGGGMTQIDTWDPKPGHRNGGEFKAIDSSIPGIQISEMLPVCASQMKHLNLLRTICTNEGDFRRATFLMHTGRREDGGYRIPSIGTILSFELGRPDHPLPPQFALDPPLIPQGSPFGDEYLPVRLNNADNPISNVHRGVDSVRHADRTRLLHQQDRDWEQSRLQEEVARTKANSSKSEELMDSPLLNAFDYHAEPASLRDDYGDRFGINCLIARRLIQAGCAFVEIGMGGWDIHADVFGNLRRMLPTFDHGIGTLVRDLAEKNLLRDVLVVVATEFGRTPSINAGKGRDHHADGFSVVLAGGNLKGGRVYGGTGPDGATPTPRISVPDLFSTIYRACGVEATKTYEAGGRRFRYTDGGTPIAHLF